MRKARTFILLVSLCVVSLPLAAQSFTFYYLTGASGQQMASFPESTPLRHSPNKAA